MAGLPIASPEALGLDSTRLDRAFALVKHWCDEDRIPGAGLVVGRRGRMIAPRFFGRSRIEDRDSPLKDDALFLVASITKPVTVTAVMMLVERGLLTLEDRVSQHVPAFAARGKADIQVRHLMTHTSGLPDMLPDNEKLRRAHKPLAAFVEGTCQVELLFPPGTRVSYQSMGTLMLAEIVHQITGTTLRAFTRKEIFDPLGMPDTWLGWQGPGRERIAQVRQEAAQLRQDWTWNSPYWLGLGAPWGGMITSPADFTRFCQMMLNEGELDGVRILSPATVRAMTSNQLTCLPGIAEEERRCRPWGLGWRLNWPGHSANFGNLLGPRTYGHWGATGTVCWIDPDAEAFCVLFTTQPQEPEGRYLARVSNLVAAALT
ncbi:MAG: serine hydrolase domain-containing protein [Gemmataceae bacterium]